MTNQPVFVADNDHRERIDYAEQQLATSRSACNHWQARAANPDDPYHQLHAQGELAYYAQQVERWLDYLAVLSK